MLTQFKAKLGQLLVLVNYFRDGTAYVRGKLVESWKLKAFVTGSGYIETLFQQSNCHW